MLSDIDGIPVTGPGGFVMINIAHNETVVAGLKIWRDIESKVEEVDVLEPSVAIEELRIRLNRSRLDKANVKVVKAEFCYFEAGANDEQSYFEPAYTFVFETKINKFPYKSVEVIPAVRTPRQSWKLEKRFSMKQTSEKRK